MRFKAVVFDFDGCLVDSAQAKYDAFFEIFPKGKPYTRVVADVLHTDPDGSRYEVIPRMANLMRAAGLALDDCLSSEERIAAYSVATLEAVAACPSLPRAEELLCRSRELGLAYISSNTPEPALRELVKRRGWLPLLDGVYGYPRHKRDTLRQIVQKCGGCGDRVIVVGDGISDGEAARDNGCFFVAVDARSGLGPAFEALETNSVQG